jgi:tetracycline resistance efflux pump
MQYSWVSLIPPLVVLSTAFITKRVLLSLCLGIVSACFIVARFSFNETLVLLLQNLQKQIFNADNIYTFIFLISLGTLIALLSHTGGTSAYSTIMAKKVSDARSAESASVLLSCLLLFDDFFSSITVGCIMRPLTDRFKIPRVKLAYLIDSMAAPLVVLIPVSSWIATLTMQLHKSGISQDYADAPLILADPFSLYVHVIPYIFYSFITLASVFYIVRWRISFGPMKRQEMIAQQTGNLYGGKPQHKNVQTTICPVDHGTLYDFFIPIVLLLLSVFIAILYSGGYHVFGGTYSITQALARTDIFFALCTGTVFALCASFFYFVSKRKVTLTSFVSLVREGIQLMGPSVAILFFAWTFSSLLIHDLKSGVYLASLLGGAPILPLLPCIFFIVSGITSIAIGSSWGTIAVMIPLATPMLIQLLHMQTPTTPDQVLLLFPLLGAAFAGAIAGDHISPISSTTVMSSTSSGAYHTDHVYTQLIYALPALIASAVAYLIAGYIGMYSTQLSLIALPIGIGLCIGILYLLNQTKK